MSVELPLSYFADRTAGPAAPVSVSSYLQRINQLLSREPGRIKGEVTSISPSGKAIYFTIKDRDEPALLNCLMWLSTYRANGMQLKVGDEVIVTGVPDIYIPYGKFAFKANTIEYAGEGALKQAYDQLKANLERGGLLSPERKRMLPPFPKKIGVITSLSGVVIQDFSANLSRHGFQVSTVDSRVEGKDAIHDLLAALYTLNKRDIDVLVIMRGGGSWESLQAFNTESVVRAIATFKVPVVTGIGHDVDVTLAEMVADIGRSTPTAVAEALNEPWEGLRDALALFENRTIERFTECLLLQQRRLERSSAGIVRSYERRLGTAREQSGRHTARILSLFTGLSQRVRAANSDLLRAMGSLRSTLASRRTFLAHFPVRLVYHTRKHFVAVEKSLTQSSKLVLNGQSNALRNADQLVAEQEKIIRLNDPNRLMQLGYSLSYVNGKLARGVKDVLTGNTVTTHLADGQFTSEVKTVQ